MPFSPIVFHVRIADTQRTVGRNGGTTEMAEPKPAQRMEHVLRAYFQACNDADAAAIATCFRPEAVHYAASPFPKISGAVDIARFFATRVPELGMFFTLDQVFTDVVRCAAVAEWTMFRRRPARFVRRGLELYIFDPQTWLIQEVRAYSAAPLDSEMPRQELLDFDYEGRGYPTTFPAVQTKYG
jgi:SnoaL-like protein